MLPCWSCAIEPIQREVVSGENVPDWKRVGVPPGLRTSYQRTPEAVDPTDTEWFTTSDSWEPKLR